MVLVSPLLAMEFVEENGEIRGEEITCETIDIMIGGGLRGLVYTPVFIAIFLFANKIVSEQVE